MSEPTIEELLRQAPEMIEKARSSAATISNVRRLAECCEAALCWIGQLEAVNRAAQKVIGLNVAHLSEIATWNDVPDALVPDEPILRFYWKGFQRTNRDDTTKEAKNGNKR